MREWRERGREGEVLREWRERGREGGRGVEGMEKEGGRERC